MSLIKSISGIRGTIGGKPGDGLSPIDVVKFTTAFATFLKNRTGKRLTLVVGRDARMSGDMVDRLVVGTLLGMGVDVIYNHADFRLMRPASPQLPLPRWL